MVLVVDCAAASRLVLLGGEWPLGKGLSGYRTAIDTIDVTAAAVGSDKARAQLGERRFDAVGVAVGHGDGRAVGGGQRSRAVLGG